ncbi:MAG: butyrate kinase, partial [Bacteroidales bacterium]|nr:butyrate kinase [Candidatus Equimonas enterica]
MKILVINPGSTSTKIAVYNDEEPLFVKNIKHNVEELAQYKEINEQLPMRKKYILEELAARDIAIDFDAVIGRGGLTR